MTRLFEILAVVLIFILAYVALAYRDDIQQYFNSAQTGPDASQGGDWVPNQTGAAIPSASGTQMDQ